MTRPTHGLVILVALAAWASSAHAQAPSVRMADTPCAAQLPEHALAGMLEIELYGDGVAGVGDVSEEDALAVVDLASTCSEPLVVRVQTRDRLTGVSLARRVELADVPPSLRVRTLALTVAELLRATWHTTVSVPEAVLLPSPTLRLATPRDVSSSRGALRVGARLTRPRGPRRPAAQTEEEEGEEPGSERFGLFRSDGGAPWRPLAVGVEGVARLFPQSGLFVLGGRGVIGAATSPATGLVFDAGVLGGPVQPREDDVGVLLLPLGVSWIAQASTDAVRFEIGPRLEGGAVQLSWGPQRRTGWGAYFVATTAGYLRVRLAEGAWVSIAADLGWTLVGPDVAGIDASPLTGPTMSLSVALLAAP